MVRARSIKRGDRKIRYTTKIRGTQNIEFRTNGFAVPAPNLMKALQRQAPRNQN